jgi:hypothetical protein
MLQFQIAILTLWSHTTGLVRDRIDDARHDDRGEITSTTVLIVILAVAAVTAGAIIAGKISDNASNIPTP